MSWKQPTCPWVRDDLHLRRRVSNLTASLVILLEFLVRVSYVELYNEDIRDLLFEAGPAAAPKLTIGDDPTHGALPAIALNIILVFKGFIAFMQGHLFAVLVRLL
jgi:hypothetical protein